MVPFGAQVERRQHAGVIAAARVAGGALAAGTGAVARARAVVVHAEQFERGAELVPRREDALVAVVQAAAIFVAVARRPREVALRSAILGL